ncbi:MAG: asparaginase [Geminicoccaceae bacterium]|nr:asparaginase [Geminicoccaceae bacterium]
MSLPLVRVLAMGGTIASIGGPGAGVRPGLGAAELVEAVPQLTDVARIEAEQFRQMASPHMTLADVVALAREILAEPVPTVVTHGTDTIEETAFALELLIGEVGPVVVTGAMRNPTLPGADGPANVLAAVQTAIDRQASGRGVMVVLNDEIHTARHVIKGNTALASTFISPQSGRIGQVVEGRPHWFASLPPLPVLTIGDDGPPGPELPWVPLWTVALGDDGRLLERAADDIDGLVVAGMGGGHVPPASIPVLEKIAKRVPVVLASRTGSGAVLERTYGYAGAEFDLLGIGAIPAGWLAPLKARVLLMLALAAGRRDIPAIFAPFR